jgi:4-amino-4-deoxy-L-arabinose transferase-like glycosyltransferase
VREGLSRPLWLVLVIAAFCLPLFIGLGRTDVENDEGIYSYAVDGMVANGDWMNPLSSPHATDVFLEKPPLKFWIVALPIRLGLLPDTEFGIRFWDAVFGATGFLYVFAIGRRLAGPICGVAAVMILFGYGPLLFEHGLRGNNMEAPLFLCYCGGMYHYIAWAEDADQRRRFRHILAVALYFYLGFMTKFVAALFLPVTLAATTALLPAARQRLVSDFSRWVLGAVLVFALAAPWFVYQQLRVGNELWRIIFGVHVFERFTSSVDPSHIHPWNYYYVEIIRELEHMGTAWLALAGIILLVWYAVRTRRVEAVAVVMWLTIPLALMSVGTSKLHHYAYPFLPPIALAAGFGPAWVLRVGRRHVESFMTSAQQWLNQTRPLSGAARKVFLTLAFLALVIAASTLITGSLNWKIGNVQVLRNSHVSRPLLVALIFATLGGRGVITARYMFPIALLLLVLPANAYEDAFGRLSLEAHPLRSARDCAMQVRQAELTDGRQGPGIYAIGEQHWFLHSYYYYLHNVGGWERAATMEPVPLEAALFEPGHQRPVMIGEADYRAFKTNHAEALLSVPIVPLREVLLLMPGPYAVCVPAVPPRTLP